MLQLSNVSHSYKLSNKSNVTILHDINFKFPDNGLVFITGKSGCGKTTLLNILEGILKPTTGDVIFNNVNIYKDKKFDFTKYVGILFQNYNLIENLSVYENLQIAADLKNLNYEIIDDLLDKYNLKNFKDSKIENLSGGEKQRIAFIRAIIGKPDIVFCDEPTGAIDDENANLLMKDLKEYSKNSLVLVVTHNLDLITKEDNFLELSKGEIITTSVNFLENATKTQYFNKKIKHKKSFLSILSKRLLKKSTFKHSLYIISIFFSILFIELTIGVVFGLNNQKDNLEFSYFNYNRFTISKKEKKIETESPISLVKEIRPAKEDILQNFNSFENIYIYNNYSFLLNGSSNIFSGSQELKNVQVELSYNLIDDVAVNQIFYDLLEDKDAKLSIELNQNYVYKLKKEGEINRTFNEKFYYSKFFKINKIVKEFKYLNIPKIYLPLDEFELYLKRSNLDKTFKETKEIISWYDAVSTANEDDELTSFSYDFYLNKKEDIINCYELMNTYNDEDEFSIKNDAHFYTNSFLEISNMMTLGLEIFCAISFLVTFCLLFFIVISLYLQEKKDIAILKILGTTNKEVNSIFNNIIILETIIAFIFSTLINYLISNIINKFIYKNLSINKLICLPNLSNQLMITIIYFLIFLILIILSLTINFLAIFRASRKQIALELREE